MAAPAHSDLVAESLLRYYRDRASNAKPALNPQDFVAYFGIVARLALGKPVAFTNPGFATPPVLRVLRCAALHFIRRTQFRDGADHYQLLAVTPDASTQAIRENHRLMIQIVHPDRAPPEAGWPDGIAARVNQAYFVLKHPDSRAAYDLQRSAGLVRPPPPWGTHPASPIAVARRNRPPPVQPALPEWLTAGVGGFVRQYPTVTIFAVLISACSLAIASVMWLDPGVKLTRGGARPPQMSAQPAESADLAQSPNTAQASPTTVQAVSQLPEQGASSAPAQAASPMPTQAASPMPAPVASPPPAQTAPPMPTQLQLPAPAAARPTP